MILITIPLPEDLKNYLTRLQLPIEDATWLNPVDLHFTLHNLGNLNGADVIDLVQELTHFTHSVIKINLNQFEITKIGEVFLIGDDKLKALKDKIGRLIKVQDKSPVRILIGYLPIKNKKSHAIFLENASHFQYSFIADSLQVLERKGHFIEIARFKLDPIQLFPRTM